MSACAALVFPRNNRRAPVKPAAGAFRNRRAGASGGCAPGSALQRNNFEAWGPRPGIFLYRADSGARLVLSC